MNDSDGRRRGLESAVATLRRGGLVGLPTETVYGLAADATDGRAVARIFAAKGRPSFNPLIVHVASLAQAERIAVFDRTARRLAGTFWPGPLTLVLPRREDSGIADLATAGLDTVAIRCPAHPVAQAVLEAFGKPLAAPSANRSGHVSATRAADVADDLGSEVGCILDAGPAGIGVESTIVGLAGGKAVLLRPGGLTREAVEEVLGRRLSMPEPDAGATAPGMLASHYAPAATLRLEAKEVRQGEALLAFGPDLPAGSDSATAIRNLSPTGDLVEAAANFFAMLRDLDRPGGTIAAMPVPMAGLGEAINDRLKRASAPRA